MKIFISFLVILLIFLYLLTQRKKNNTENFEDTKSPPVVNKFRKNFSNDYFYPKYYILIRDDSNSWKDMVEPKSIFYQSRLDNLEDIYKSMSSYFIENVKPNFSFKINIPLNSILEKTYLNYNLTNISPNQQNKNYPNFLFYKFYSLVGGPNTILDSNISIFQNAIQENNKDIYLNNERNPIMYELPTRLDGDTRDENGNIKLHMFLFFFKYNLKFKIYSLASLNLNNQIKNELSNLKVSYQIGNKKEVSLIGSFEELQPENKEIKYGNQLLGSLYRQVMSILVNKKDIIDVDDVSKTDGNKNYSRELVKFSSNELDLATDNNYFLYIYDTTDSSKKFHGKKIKKIIQTLLYYFSSSIDDVMKTLENDSNKIISSIPTEDLPPIMNIIEIIISKPSSIYDSREDYIKTTGKEENLTTWEAYLDTTKSIGVDLMTEFNKISDDTQTKIMAFEIKEVNAKKVNTIEDLESKIYKKEDVSLNVIEVTYDFDISEYSPSKLVSEAPDMSPEAVTQRLVSRLNIQQKLMYHLQINLRQASRQRDRTFALNSDFLTDELKFEINKLTNDLSSDNDSVKQRAMNNIRFIEVVMEAMNTRRIEIINYILDFNIVENTLPLQNYLEEKLNEINYANTNETSEVSNLSPGEGFTTYTPQIGKQGDKYTIGDNYKKNMDDIYKRLKDFQMKANLNKIKYEDVENETVVLENFSDLRLHKHGGTGQINFIYPLETTSPEVGPREFEDEKWLMEPSNLRLLNSYKFLSEGQKSGILKEMDKMENTLDQLDNYTSGNLANITDKLHQIEKKAKKEIMEDEKKQLEAKMSDTERAMLYFNETQSEQEKKMKRMNEKIDQLEKDNKDINLSRFDQINSIRSMGDGQVISVIPKKNNMYQLRANSGCVSYVKKVDGVQLDVKKCEESPTQRFQLHHISNVNEYNQHLKKPIDNLAEVYYPFELLTLPSDKTKCMSVRGNKTSMVDCENSKYHRFDSLRNIRECDSKYGN